MRRSATVVLMAALVTTLLWIAGHAQAAPVESGPRLVKIDSGVYAATGARVAVEPAGRSGLIPISPTRVLDTREGLGTGGVRAPIGQGQTITLDLKDIVPSNTSTAVLNLIGTQTTSYTYLTIWPAEDAQPSSSNISLDPNTTRANAVQVAVGVSRVLKVYNSAGSAHAIMDLAGYYKVNEGARYTPKTPVRVFDTRGGQGPVGPSSSTVVDFTPHVSATATAVTFNLTGVLATAHTFVTAWPNGTSQPGVSNLNLNPGEVTPNLVTVRLGADKKVRLYNNAGSVDLLADLAGYYSADAGFWYYSTTPSRLLDTRMPGEGPGLEPHRPLVVAGFQDEIRAVVTNMTGTNTSASGTVVAWPGGQSQPFVSNLNLVTGQTAANLAIAGVGRQGDFNGINFANQAGYVDIILDAAGYFGDYAPVG